ncbi:MAG: hypothetical protein ABFD64_11220 [Armatimonadota bacterium]
MSNLSRRALLPAFACAALVVITGLSARAEFVPPVDYAARGSEAVVTINDRVAIRFKVPNAKLTPLERAKLTASRLKPLATGGWKAITVKSASKKRSQVVVNDKVICIATAADASANGTSAQALSESWVRSIRRLFSMPPITLTPAEITIPESEKRMTAIGGAAQGAITLSDGNPAVAVSSFDSARRSVVVTGRAVGRSTVEISCQGCSCKLVVNVKRYAGRVTGMKMVEVTGEPAPDWLLNKVARKAAASVVALEPGAAATFGSPKITCDSLGKGESVRVLVPVRARGSKFITADLFAPVEVVNRPLSHKSAVDLFYSNDPERLTQYGTLFTGKLSFDEKTRLFYHHQNMMGKRVRLAVELLNAGDTEAGVQTISGIGRPIVDTVVVGYMAGMDFIRDHLRNVGMVYRIPPRSKIVVYADNLSHNITASGIIDLRQFAGGDVYVKVTANPPSLGQLSDGQVASISDTEIPRHLSEHVYMTPTKQLDAKYVIGERWEFIRIGKYAIKDAADKKQLFGNYGVIYNINIRIENPTADARTVKIIFDPTAGPASGIFVVEGRIIGVKMVAPPREFQITAVRVPAGQSKELTITTMPLGGSAYPASIVIRP